MTQNIREQILELFCGFPIDCTTETEIKLDEILKTHLNTTLKEIEEEVEQKKFSGKLLHDLDIYTPREINDILDDTKQLIHQKLI